MISHRPSRLLTPLIGAALFLVQSPAHAAPKPGTSTPPAPAGTRTPTQQPVAGKAETSVAELSIARLCGNYPGAKDMVIAQDGAIYGTSYGGGRFGAGFVFKLNPDAFSRVQKARQGSGPAEPQPTDFSIVHAFGDPRDQPSLSHPGFIIRGEDGKLYTDEDFAGSFCLRFDPSNQSAEAVKTQVDNSNDPDYTIAQATWSAKCFAVDADGMLWCIGGQGLVFHTRGNSRDFGALTQTRSWTIAVDGGDGYLYGTTLDSVEKIKKDGSDYAVLHKFTGSDNGTTEPVGRPVVLKNGMVYGYAHPDRSTGLYSGILYKIDRQGNNFAIVESLNADPDGVLFADGNCVYGVSEKGFYQVCDPRSEVALIAPSKKQHYLKAMVFDDKFAYALADADSIFRIPLPSPAPSAR